MTKRYGKYHATVPINDHIGMAPSDDGVQILEVTRYNESFMVDLTRDEALSIATYILNRYEPSFCDEVEHAA